MDASWVGWTETRSQEHISSDCKFSNLRCCSLYGRYRKPCNRFVNRLAFVLLMQYEYHLKYITMSAQGVDVQKLVCIDSAITDPCMREKTRFRVDFLFTCPSVTLFGYTSHFSADLNAYWLAQTTCFYNHRNGLEHNN